MSASTKWRVSVQRPIKAPPEKVWNIVGNFCGLKRWSPTVETCEILHGQDKIPGCVRYCAGNSSHLHGLNGGGMSKSWVKEKLLEFDHGNRRYKYKILEGNLGMEGYMAALQVVDGEGGTAAVKWTVEMDAMPGKNEQEFVRTLSVKLSELLLNVESVAAMESS